MEQSQETEWFCGCESECTLSVMIPKALAIELAQSGNVLIVDRCQTGPKNTDKLLRECNGYKIYTPEERP